MELITDAASETLKCWIQLDTTPKSINVCMQYPDVDFSFIIVW